MMRRFISVIALGLLVLSSRRADAASVVIGNQTAGPTPFIRQLQLTATPAASIKSIRFQITPKPGSVTRPLSATYTSDYLKKRGYYNTTTGAILLPVFGLYDNFTNNVGLTFTFTDNSAQPATIMMTTAQYNDPCGYRNRTVIQPRTNTTTLSYDYMLVRNGCITPLIIDTDGLIRWVGAAGLASFPAILFQNSLYVGQNANVYRLELDGTFVTLQNYSSAGIADFHHNIDLGKRGLVLDVNTSTDVESINIEIDGLGNILKTWDMASIISAAMTAGGDNPSQFVTHGADWFHNNATTYKASDDSILISSRENFIIALDYSTSAIKWIMGDPTKQWHQFPSLTAFALAFGANTLPQIGQHALSITKDDELLLFDNGRNSTNHTPPGDNRTYSAPRKYHINTQAKVATELWNYPNNQGLDSDICSSVYEDSPLNYLVDYAHIINISPPALFAEILGLDASGNKIFDYRYTTSGCTTAYNSAPIHLENVMFTVMTPPTAVSRKVHPGAGTFDIPLPLTGTPGVECRSGGGTGDYQVVVTSPPQLLLPPQQ